MNAVETELVGVTIDKKTLTQIEKLLTQLNIKLPTTLHYNRQDFIRMAIQEKIDQMEQSEAGVKP